MKDRKQQPRDVRASEDAEQEDRKLGHYYVPSIVADYVHDVLPELDLDPCGHPGQLVRAKKVIVGSNLLGIDGLNAPLEGVRSVYLNPPALQKIPTQVDPTRDPGTRPDGTKKPPILVKMFPNYPFHPMSEWFSRYINAYNSKEISQLLVIAPARTSVPWFNTLTREAPSLVVFHKRVCCHLQQRDCQGQLLPARQMRSPNGGTVAFGFGDTSFLQHVSDVTRKHDIGTLFLKPTSTQR